MLISQSHKFIFFHIPKTAGSSVTAALLPFLGRAGRNPKIEVGKFGWQKWAHTGGNMHQKVLPDLSIGRWSKYRAFTVVRNPWDRFASMALNLDKTDGKRNWTGDLWSLERRLKGDRKFPRRYWFQPCARWAMDSMRVLRFERLNEDWLKLCDLLELGQVTLPHTNRRKGSVKLADWREYYQGDQDLIEAVGRRYKEDVDRFGYTFEAL